MSSPTGQKTAPEIIDITDLHHPVRSALQQQVWDFAETQPVVFTEDAVLGAARAQTGLSDFGPDDFHENLQMWLKALEADTGASPVTRMNMFGMTVRYAATRLMLEDLIKRHPEILDIKIDRPIVVAGLPRSGTTHLLNLISADTRLRSLPWWEAIAPIPGPDDVAKPGEPDPRWTRADAGWQQQDATMPYLKAMHEFSPDHVSEDIELQALNFSSYLIEWLATTPSWRDYYFATDQTPTYRYLKKGLQALTWLKGPNRWVLKCPQHMEQLPVLHEVFPDATIVITHRDPVASIQSAITMTAYAARLLRREVDTKGLSDYWIDRYERLLRRCVADHDKLPAGQVLDVYFQDLINDPDTVLREIYKRADLPLPPETLVELHDFLDQHPAGQHGKVVYDLRRDFGLSPEEVRAHFDFYLERFPVKVEVR